MPLSDYFSPKQFAFTPDKAAAIGTGNEGQKFMSKSYDPTVNNLQSIGPAYWDYVAHTLDKAGKPRTDYTGMLQDMLGRYGTVTADTKAPDWFLKGERYNYFSPQSPTAYAGASTYVPKSTMPVQPIENTGVVIPDLSKMPKPSEGVGFHISSSYDANASPSAIADWEAKMRDLEKRVLAGQVSESVSPAMNVPVSMPSGKANPVMNVPASAPAGNNIASGVATPPNPNSAMSGTQFSGVQPNMGTDINQSPFSPTAGTRKRTSPNKYFNQRWFGTKQIA